MTGLRFHNLTLGYERHPAVHHLDGTVESGSMVAVVGPNGAGKSTLFKGIVGALKPLAGSIERDGLDARDIAYLPQAAETDRSFPIRLYDMVAMGLWRQEVLSPASAARIIRPSKPPSPRSASPDSSSAPSAAWAGRCGGCCLPACCCRTRGDRAR